MKEKFRKLQILSSASQSVPLLEKLQMLGVIHVEEHETDQADDTSLEEAIHQRNRLLGVYSLLKTVNTPTAATKNKSEDVDKVVAEIIELERQIEQIQQEIEAAENEAERLSPWGDFNYNKFEPVIQQGYNVFLCTCTKKVWKTLDLGDWLLYVTGRYGSNVYFAIVTAEDNLHIPVEYFALPKESVTDLKGLIRKKEKEREDLHQKIQSLAPYLSAVEQQLAGAEDDVFLLSAVGASKILASGNLVGISGWVPEAEVEKVGSFLDQLGASYQLREPLFGERVPVVLKNNKYTKLFEPITRIFELPNYYETDPTPFIAVFYPILFAYCLGDAGYGAVLLGASLYGYFTIFRNKRSLALLGIILGVVTTIMGLVKSGSLFGIPLGIDQGTLLLSFLGKFVLIPDDSDYIFNAFNVALMIGVVQIISGILISIYNKARYEASLQALSALGKLFIVSTLIWIFLSDMQGIEALQGAGFVKYGLLIVGVLLVMFFHQTELSIGRRAASSVMPLFFIFTGILGDILSFVRLFALGLASSVLGLVVNQIGDQIMSGGAVGLIIGIVFLLFGHTLNFGIAALGSFVHPLRLTFVEFYGNADFEGKGVVYKPLSKSFNTTHNT